MKKVNILIKKVSMLNNMLSNFFTPSNTARYRTEGKVNYFVEPIETKGRLPLNTCSVTVKAYTNQDKQVQLPVKIKWYKLQAERNYELEELENVDHYNFSAMDIGVEVKVSLRSMDENYKGVISIIFGPVKFDEILRPPLESVLLSGFSKFNAMVNEEDSTHHDKVQPISVFMSPNQIKFFYYTDNEEESFYLEITNERPRLEVVFKDPDSLVLYFDEVGLENESQIKRKIYKETNNEQEQFSIHLRFFSSSSRDIFLTAIRLFRIVPVCALSNLFRQIDMLLRENRLFENNNKVTLNELLVEHDLLRTNLLSTIEYAKDLDKDREELQECVTVLERDLEHTMIQFKKYIEENMRGGSGLRNETSGLRKLDELNASLLSNRGDMKSVIKKKLDESNPQILEKALKSHHGGVGVHGLGPTVSLSEFQELQKKLQHEVTLKEMFQKRIKEMENKSNKKKAVAREISKHMANVSKEIHNIKEETSKIHSQMFDVSGIDSRADDGDMLASDPFILQDNPKKKSTFNHLTNGGSNLFKIEESPNEKRDGGISDSAKMELRVKEEENRMLRDRIKDLESKVLQMKTDSAASMRNNNEEATQDRINQLTKEIELQKSREKDLQQEAELGYKFIEEFRRLLKSAIAEDEPNLKPPLNSSLIDESLMNDVFKVNLNTKLKMVDLENDSLKKRVNSLTKEVYLLREETRQLKSDRSTTTIQTTQQQGVSKEEHESVKRQNNSLLMENDNLRNLLDRLKKQDDSLNGVAGNTISSLKKELSELAAVNQSLLQQKQDLAKKNEQIKSQVSTEKRDEAEERREKIIIEQLSKTNDRLMNELNNLQDKIAAYEDARMSFISDVNDSYMSQSVRGSGNIKNRFK